VRQVRERVLEPEQALELERVLVLGLGLERVRHKQQPSSRLLPVLAL